MFRDFCLLFKFEFFNITTHALSLEYKSDSGNDKFNDQTECSAFRKQFRVSALHY